VAHPAVRRTWIERLDPPFLLLHAATWTASGRCEVRRDARRFENWGSYVAGRAGRGVAVDDALGWELVVREEASLRYASAHAGARRSSAGSTVATIGRPMRRRLLRSAAEIHFGDAKKVTQEIVQALGR